MGRDALRAIGNDALRAIGNDALRVMGLARFGSGGRTGRVVGRGGAMRSAARGGVARLRRGQGAGLPAQDELFQEGEEAGEAGIDEGVQAALGRLGGGGGVEAGEGFGQRGLVE